MDMRENRAREAHFWDGGAAVVRKCKSGGGYEAFMGREINRLGLIQACSF